MICGDWGKIVSSHKTQYYILKFNGYAVLYNSGDKIIAVPLDRKQKKIKKEYYIYRVDEIGSQGMILEDVGQLTLE